MSQIKRKQADEPRPDLLDDYLVELQQDGGGVSLRRVKQFRNEDPEIDEDSEEAYLKILLEECECAVAATLAACASQFHQVFPLCGDVWLSLYRYVIAGKTAAVKYVVLCLFLTVLKYACTWMSIDM